MSAPRLRATWHTARGIFSAHEPDQAEIERVSPVLSVWYSDSYNRQMTATPETYSPEQAAEFHRREREAGGKTFLLFYNEKLVGDATFMRVVPPTAEIGLMIGDRTNQGLGLGTSLSILAHALVFQALPLDAIYGSVVPGNEAAMRCHGKVGYVVDDSPLARSFADADDEVCIVLPRHAFERRNREVLAQLVIERVGS